QKVGTRDPLSRAKTNSAEQRKRLAAIPHVENRGESRLFGSVGFRIGDEDPFTYAFSFGQLVLKLPQLVCRVDDLSRAPARASAFSTVIQLYRNGEVAHPILLPKRNHLSSNHPSPPLFLRRQSCRL